MYKILSPLRNNGKFYGIGDRIAESELSQGDRDSLVKQKVIEPESTVSSVESSPAPSAVPSDVVPPQQNEDAGLEASSSPRVVREDWSTFTGVLAKDMDIIEYVNFSDAKGLERIKGVGASTAKAMVNHKTTSGDFTSVSQLSQLVPSIKWEQIEVVDK